jgi:hypothetical protein
MTCHGLLLSKGVPDTGSDIEHTELLLIAKMLQQLVLETRVIGQVNNHLSFQRTAQRSAGNRGNAEMTITETLAVQGGGPVASLAIPCSEEVTDRPLTTHPNPRPNPGTG